VKDAVFPGGIANNAAFKDVQAFLDSSAYSMLKFLENTYDCSMVCEPPLFFVTKGTIDNLPPQGCFPALV
jgi:hypothetical protein